MCTKPLVLLTLTTLLLIDGNKTQFKFPWSRIAWFIQLIVFNEVPVSGNDLVSYFSQRGLSGEIHFMKSTNNLKLVKIKTFLETTLQFPEQQWSWSYHQNPVDYSIIDPDERCNLDHVGPQIMSFDDVLGYLYLPGNDSSVWDDVTLNLTGKWTVKTPTRRLVVETENVFVFR